MPILTLLIICISVNRTRWELGGRFWVMSSLTCIWTSTHKYNYTLLQILCKIQSGKSLPFIYEYFYLHLHSQWWFEVTFNSLLFSTFRRTEQNIALQKKFTKRNLHVSNLLLVRLAATLHQEHNECHRVLASTQSSLQIKALVNLKIHQRSGEVIVSNSGKNFFFPSHQKQLTRVHERT